MAVCAGSASAWINHGFRNNNLAEAGPAPTNLPYDFAFINRVLDGQGFGSCGGAGQKYGFPDTTTLDPTTGYLTAASGTSLPCQTAHQIPTQAQRPGNWIIDWGGTQSFGIQESGNTSGSTFAPVSPTCSSGYSTNYTGTPLSVLQISGTSCKIQIAITGPVNFVILNYNAGSFTGTLTPVRWYHTDDNECPSATLLAAGAHFDCRFINAFKSAYGVIRFMDKQETNVTNVAFFGDYRPTTWWNYSQNSFYLPSRMRSGNTPVDSGDHLNYTLAFPGFTLTDRAQVFVDFGASTTMTAQSAVTTAFSRVGDNTLTFATAGFPSGVAAGMAVGHATNNNGFTTNAVVQSVSSAGGTTTVTLACAGATSLGTACANAGLPGPVLYKGNGSLTGYLADNCSGTYPGSGHPGNLLYTTTVFGGTVGVGDMIGPTIPAGGAFAVGTYILSSAGANCWNVSGPAQAINIGGANAYHPGVASGDTIYFSPTLNVNSTGAIPVYSNIGSVLGNSGTGPSIPFVPAGSGGSAPIYTFTYDQEMNAWLPQQGWIWTGWPIALMVEVANLTGAHPWFNLPYLSLDFAGSTFPTQLATYVKANLTPNLIPRFEGPNETWNFAIGFNATKYASNKEIWYSGQMSDLYNWYGRAMAQAGQQISAVYGDDRTKYELVIGMAASAMSGVNRTYAARNCPFQEDCKMASPEYVTNTGNQPAYHWATAITYAGYWHPNWGFINGYTPMGNALAYEWTFNGPYIQSQDMNIYLGTGGGYNISCCGYGWLANTIYPAAQTYIRSYTSTGQTIHNGAAGTCTGSPPCTQNALKMFNYEGDYDQNGVSIGFSTVTPETIYAVGTGSTTTLTTQPSFMASLAPSGTTGNATMSVTSAPSIGVIPFHTWINCSGCTSWSYVTATATCVSTCSANVVPSQTVTSQTITGRTMWDYVCNFAVGNLCPGGTGSPLISVTGIGGMYQLNTPTPNFPGVTFGVFNVSGAVSGTLGVCRLTLSSAITGGLIVAGTSVTVSGIVGSGGDTGCNGSTTVSAVVDSTHIELTGTTFANSYASGGVVGTANIFFNGNVYPNSQPVNLTCTVSLPGGVSSGVTYYVVGTSGNLFSVAATVGGSAITFTSVSSGSCNAPSGIATFPASGSTITASNQLAVNELVIFTGQGATTLPTSSPQIALSTPYFVTSATSSTFQISTTKGGSAITFSGAGSGTFLAQGAWVLNSATATTINLDVDSTGFSAFTSGGNVKGAFMQTYLTNFDTATIYAPELAQYSLLNFQNFYTNGGQYPSEYAWSGNNPWAAYFPSLYTNLPTPKITAAQQFTHSP